MIVDGSKADDLLVRAVRLAIDARSLTLDSLEAFRDCSRLTFLEPSREFVIEEFPAP